MSLPSCLTNFHTTYLLWLAPLPQPEPRPLLSVRPTGQCTAEPASRHSIFWDSKAVSLEPTEQGIKSGSPKSFPPPTFSAVGVRATPPSGPTVGHRAQGLVIPLLVSLTMHPLWRGWLSTEDSR